MQLGILATSIISSYHNFLYSLREINFPLASDSNSYKEEIANVIQRTFHELTSRRHRSICLPNLYKKKQSQDTTTEFIKALVKFCVENHTDEIIYVRIESEEPSEIQHYRKPLSTWITQEKPKTFYLINLK